jgi:hypothetical protein
MPAIIAAILGLFVSFPSPVTVTAYDHPDGTLSVLQGTVHNGEYLLNRGHYYQVVQARGTGRYETFRTLPQLAGNSEVLFYVVS